MEDKLTGLVLKNLPIGDTKNLITVLTAERGKKLIACHGARKLTGRNMPATQPFCLCEFIVSEKNNRLTLKESYLIESFFELRCELLDCCVGSYILETGAECAREEEDERELLSLMLNSLHALCSKDHDRVKIKSAFELRLLAIEGSGPVCDVCVCCGKPLGKEFWFSPAEGGTVCGLCRNSGVARAPLYPLDEGARMAMAYILHCPPKRIFSFKLGRRSTQYLETASREALVYTFDKIFESLKFYEQQKDILPEE